MSTQANHALPANGGIAARLQPACLVAAVAELGTMNNEKPLTDVTSTLLDGFSPFLHRVFFDFSSNLIEFELLDRVEQPTAFRVLRFERIRELQITPHEPDEVDPNFIDSVIGAQRSGDDFQFTTEYFSIFFSCGTFHAHNRDA